ncbi:LexA family transcriptional regulator [Enterococcus gallinarum]|jgi:SOS-response transcriptional repressor LexA|uniref:LexA family transcriptional regulator n=1 Tax=Enterococcus gallinarum TaxID=1353 RepID=UPI0011DD0441|nr:XRE family transcriptional regulator [Enterococcus gallinarum]MCR1932675.1 XRE family transcriptional regulator [Enterococcus gallinarum]TXX10363.1 helix-turn-helix domain-containing protein [Enterococcus gallinarum]DAL85390.1 MAG TPA: Repressor protein CI [Caudoviricetes sp.]
MARKPLSQEDKEIRRIIAENLKRITHGYTRAQVSEKTGIPTSTLSGYFIEKSTINKENAEAIAAAFNVDKADIDPRYSRNYDLHDMKKEVFDELLNSKSSSQEEQFEKFLELSNKANKAGMNLSRMNTDRGNNITAFYHDTHDYNFFDTSIAAGLPTSIEAFEEDHIEQIAIPDYAMGKYSGMTDIFFTKTNGDSMNNVIPNGSLIAVKRIDDFSELKNEDIVVFSNDNEFSVKRFINDKENQRIIFRPDSSNVAFTDIVVSYEDAKELRIYGKVVVYIVQL